MVSKKKTTIKTFPEPEGRRGRYIRVIWPLVFVGVLAFASVLRVGTFYQTHQHGDQFLYTVVAMKLDKFGFKGYNLREVTVVRAEESSVKKIVYEKDFERTLLAKFKKDGFSYYDEPVFYAPPVLPYLIKFSHDIFARGKDYVYAFPYKATKIKPPEFLKVDFYRTIVPFLFSLLTIILLIIFCKAYFNKHIALYSALLLSVSPIDIMCASRIWADSILTFSVTLSLMLFYMASEKENLFYAVLSGLSCALAILTKVSALTVLPIVGLYHLWINKHRMNSFKGAISVLFDRKLVAFGVVAFFITLPWFWTITKNYGNPLHIPFQENLEQLQRWFKIVRSRPWYTYLVDIPCQNPLLLLSFISLFFTFKNTKAKSLLTVWALIFFLVLSFKTGGRENRYMLPAYPALAILAAFVLNHVRELVNMKFIKGAGNMLILVLLAGSIAWSVKLAFYYVFHLKHNLLIPFPF